MERTPPTLRSQGSAAPGRAQLRAATMELGLEGPGPELHCHEAAAGVGSGRLRICAPVRAGSVPARISAEWGALPAAPPAWKKSLLLSTPTRGARRGEGQAGAAALSAGPAVVDCVTVPARESSASLQRGGPPVPARTSGTSERQESSLGERGTKEPQADAFETKFICLPCAQASRWGCTGQWQECERRVATLVCSRERGASQGFRGPRGLQDQSVLTGRAGGGEAPGARAHGSLGLGDAAISCLR